MVEHLLEEVACDVGVLLGEGHIYLPCSSRSRRQSSLISSSACIRRPSRTCSKVAPSRVAFLLVRFCHRSTITSQYLASSSEPQQSLPVTSAAASVVPLPRKGS